MGPMRWWGQNRYSYEGKFWNLLKSNTAHGCTTCYEGETFSGQCCNTCDELKRAYTNKGINENLAFKRPQCQAAWVGTKSENEGCLVGGKVSVYRGLGNFHFAVGEAHIQEGKHHHHWPEQARKLGFNTTHYIHHLSFGDEFPGLENPLDGTMFVEKTVGQQQYFIQVVPTIYHRNGQTIQTNQFSVSSLHVPIDVKSDHVELPGVFFKYDISAIMIKLEEVPRPAFILLVRLLAFVGGIWVVIGMVYRTSFTAVTTIAKKLE